MRFDDNLKLLEALKSGRYNNQDVIVNILFDISTSLAVIADSSELGKLLIEQELKQRGEIE